MIRDLWVAWGLMTAAVVANGVAAFFAPTAMWVTVPVVLLFVLHYYRVMRKARP